MILEELVSRVMFHYARIYKEDIILFFMAITTKASVSFEVHITESPARNWSGKNYGYLIDERRYSGGYSCYPHNEWDDVEGMVVGFTQGLVLMLQESGIHIRGRVNSVSEGDEVDPLRASFLAVFSYLPNEFVRSEDLERTGRKEEHVSVSYSFSLSPLRQKVLSTRTFNN